MDWQTQIPGKQFLKKKQKIRHTTIIAWLFLLPWLIGFILFSAYPFFYSLYLAFCEVQFTYGGISTNFIGMRNIIRALLGEGQLDFVPALFSFAGSTLVYTPLILVFSLVLAILLKRPLKLKGFFRAVFFIPVVILSGPVVSELSSGGLIQLTGVRELVIVRMVAVLSPELMHLILFLFDNLIVIFWYSGVQIIIFLNALQKIDRSIYEACSVDGATAWQSFWMITLPIIKPMTVLVSIYTIVQIGAFANNPVSRIIRDNLFAININAGYGYSAALAWIYFLVIFLLIGIFYFLLRDKQTTGKTNKTNVSKKMEVNLDEMDKPGQNTAP